MKYKDAPITLKPRSQGFATLIEEEMADKEIPPYTRRQAAAIYGCKKNFISKLIRKNLLPNSRRVGNRWMIDPDDLHRLMESERAKARKENK